MSIQRNTSEVDTLIANVNACRTRFHLTNITIVFDRGIVSDDNLTAIRRGVIEVSLCSG